MEINMYSETHYYTIDKHIKDPEEIGELYMYLVGSMFEEKNYMISCITDNTREVLQTCTK